MFSAIIGVLVYPLILLALLFIFAIVIDNDIIGKIIDSIASRYYRQLDEEAQLREEEAQLSEKLAETTRQARAAIVRAQRIDIIVERELDKELNPWKYESCAKCRYYERMYYSDGDHEGKCTKHHGRYWPASNDPPYETPACEDFAK